MDALTRHDTQPDAAPETGPGAPRIAVVYNPIAGRRRRRFVRRALDALRARAGGLSVLRTRAPADAIGRTRAAAPLADVIVAAGGDGTINEVVNGLDAMGPEAPPLAILPLGTANVLACEIGLPRSVARLAEVVHDGAPMRVVPGTVNGSRFLLMVGVGFDALAVRLVNPRIKYSLGAVAYVLSTLQAMRRFAYPEYAVEIDGVAHTARSLIVARARCYGGPFALVPEARLDVPRLHVVLFQGRGPLAVLRYGLGVATGRLHRYRDVAIVPATRVVVRGPVGDACQVDGDLGPALPLEIGLADHALTLRVPRE